MVEVLQWLAFALPVGAISLGCVWAFGQQSLSAVGEQVRELDPPAGVALTPAVRHAIGTELHRRRRLGTHASMVIAVLGVVALHPMYAPEQLAHGTVFGISVLGGLVIGETYAATHAARSPNGRRVASLHPRGSATYLSATQRIIQVVLAAALAIVTVTLLLGARTASAPAWVETAAYACVIWLVLSCGLLIAQRWAREQPPPVDDEREFIVREYVTAAAIQQLHKAIWATGALVYVTVVGYQFNDDFDSLMVALCPPFAIWMGVVGYRRWRQLPDPVWYFARTAGSPA